MIGLIVFSVLGVLIYVDYKIALWISKRIFTVPFWRLGTIAITMFLLVLLFADEIIGKIQFQALCQANSNLKIDAKNIKGKTVKLVIDPSNKHLTGFALPIRHSYYSYRDTTTGVEYANFNVYRATGGWIARKFSETRYPITFDSTCVPPNRDLLDQKYLFLLVN